MGASLHLLLLFWSPLSSAVPKVVHISLLPSLKSSLHTYDCFSYTRFLRNEGKGDGEDVEDDDPDGERYAMARSTAGAKKARKAEAEYESDVS